MDSLTSTILSVLISLTPSYKDTTQLPSEQCGKGCSTESEEQRTHRMGILASAISEASYKGTCQNIWDTDECKCINEFDNDSCRNKQVLFKGTEKELAVSLISIGYEESRFALNVHENNCYPGECDEAICFSDGKCLSVNDKISINRIKNGNYGNFRFFKAKTNWQIQKVPSFLSEEDWSSIAGSDIQSTKRAAWVAAKIWTFCWNKSRIPKNAFVCYAGSSKPNEKKWSARANRYYYRLAEFNKLYSE